MKGTTSALALLLGAMLAGCVGGDDPVDVTSLDGLVLDVSPETGPATTEFTFDASDTAGASSLDFTWTFGDGETAEGALVKHTFRYDNNRYRVAVKASDGVNDLESFVEVPVGSGVNQVPIVDVQADRTWIAHEEALAVHASASDPDGDPVAIEWLLTKNMAAGGDGHDHDHGSGVGGASGFGIPEPTGKTGEAAEFSFTESGTYRVVARASDPKGGRGEAFVDVKVTQTVPKTTFNYTEEGTLLVGSAGAGASLILYGLLQPSQNTFVDSARYDFRLLYPGNGTVTLDWAGSTAPADLDLVIETEGGEQVLALENVDPAGTTESAPIELSPGGYVAFIKARAGAQVPYTLAVSLTLAVPGLNVVDDGRAHEH